MRVKRLLALPCLVVALGACGTAKHHSRYPSNSVFYGAHSVLCKWHGRQLRCTEERENVVTKHFTITCREPIAGMTEARSCLGHHGISLARIGGG